MAKKKKKKKTYDAKPQPIDLHSLFSGLSSNTGLDEPFIRVLTVIKHAAALGEV